MQLDFHMVRHTVRRPQAAIEVSYSIEENDIAIHVLSRERGKCAHRSFDAF